MLETDLNPLTSIQTRKHRPTFRMVPASKFSIEQLTDIYNQTRMDYVVPMPMSKAKLKEYVHNYDVDLTHSVVVTSEDRPFGLAMLGVRGDRTWVTRLGIIPDGRKKGVGRAMMDELINNSKRLGARTVVLEVIKKNKPARSLFGSLGFETLRELLVIRRPPLAEAEPVNSNLPIDLLGHQDAVKLLEKRADKASWVTANPSMFNAGNLSALLAHLPNGEQAWLVYQNTPFQLGRVVLQTGDNVPLEVATTLLRYLHTTYSLQDTVVENLAADDMNWPAFQSLNYILSFIRVEMELDLTVWALNKASVNLPVSV